MTGQDHLATAVWEADRHLAVLEAALRDWYADPASDLEAVESDQEKVRLLDQLLFRFTKLQDAMGLRLVPTTLSTFSEPFEDWPMIDRLNRLEKLGFLNVTDWLRWPEIRNRLAHEYPDQAETRFAAIMLAISAADGLAEIYRNWRNTLIEANAVQHISNH
ncbi:hypothetical protein [Allochromatium vinosum]|uniref:hypothetical protein n=1 Tax=Allochromatium vinosum TaxID=1049 RepID=UPI001903BFDB|nr:hypothetical protein [Allochromatium vinosum]MBK1654776.1 hypothetical protein [Allochromatium vinosum]